MNTVQTMFSTLTQDTVANLVLEITAKSVLVVGVGWLLALLSWRAAAATRHFLWLAALASLLLLPAAVFWAPRWTSPKWAEPLGIADLTGNTAPESITWQLPATGATGTRTRPQASQLAVSATALTQQRTPSWRAIIFPCWFAGALSTALMFLSRRRLLKPLERAARPVTDPGVLDIFQSIIAEFHLTPRVRLRQISEPLIPIMWGIWRPTAVLPAEATQWPRQRLRSVLRHELAHVRRRDCLTQCVAAAVCALYWFNPLVWFASAQMRVERERACDDLVAGCDGTRPSDYAALLLDMARQFSPAPRIALPIAKRSGLEWRLRALLDHRRNHGPLTHPVAVAIALAFSSALVCFAGWSSFDPSTPQREQLDAAIKHFSALKLKQSQTLAAAAGEKITPEYQAFFDAALRGDGQAVSNQFQYFRHDSPYWHGTKRAIEHPRTAYWQPVLELCLAYEDSVGSAKYAQQFANGIINSIPPGSIYFGGTDPGRGLVTALCPDQPSGDPFFVLTQNALVDSNYLDYARHMYGEKVHLPSGQEVQADIDAYTKDSALRWKHDLQHPNEPTQLVPGEEVHLEPNGQAQVSGQVAVMKINGLIARQIFDQNPARQFYIEESFPLDWMRPYLEPHGLIMKINRQPFRELPSEVIDMDHAYWSDFCRQAIGDWITYDTSVQQLCDWAQAVYLRHDMSRFTGDPKFIQDPRAPAMFSKLRNSIAASIYQWRSDPKNTPDASDHTRMAKEAEFALKQSFALCPSSLEAFYDFANLLITSSPARMDDARLLAQTAQKLNPTNEQLAQLAEQMFRPHP